VAKGLEVSVVSAGKAARTSTRWSSGRSRSRRTSSAATRKGVAQPALQKISLATGAATTIATGLSDCDPVRATPWGTVLFGEENGSVGAMYELIDPLSSRRSDHQQTTGVSSSPNIRRVNALGFLSFEGLAILLERRDLLRRRALGEQRRAAGAYYKFVPTTPWAVAQPSRASTSRRTRPARLRLRGRAGQ
jgi:hypothetical protein